MKHILMQWSFESGEQHEREKKTKMESERIMGSHGLGVFEANTKPVCVVHYFCSSVARVVMEQVQLPDAKTNTLARMLCS